MPGLSEHEFVDSGPIDYWFRAVIEISGEDPEGLVEPWVMTPRTMRLNPNPEAGLLPERGNCEVYEEGEITSQIRHEETLKSAAAIENVPDSADNHQDDHDDAHTVNATVPQRSEGVADEGKHPSPIQHGEPREEGQDGHGLVGEARVPPAIGRIVTVAQAFLNTVR